MSTVTRKERVPRRVHPFRHRHGRRRGGCPLAGPSLLEDGLILLASTISAITVFLLIVYLRRTYSAMRWMAIGVALAALFSVYPILFNVYISFTNMGGGHLISKQQSIERLESEQFLAEGGRHSPGPATSRATGTGSCSSTPIRPASCPTMVATRRSSWTGRASAGGNRGLPDDGPQ